LGVCNSRHSKKRGKRGAPEKIIMKGTNGLDPLYANMWGTYFVKHLRANSGDQLKKLASCQATRTKATHTIVHAKTTVKADENPFIHNNTPECQVLWEMATESVFELADKLDDSGNKK
jgi:hypothetical protein